MRWAGMAWPLQDHIPYDCLLDWMLSHTQYDALCTGTPWQRSWSCRYRPAPVRCSQPIQCRCPPRSLRSAVGRTQPFSTPATVLL